MKEIPQYYCRMCNKYLKDNEVVSQSSEGFAVNNYQPGRSLFFGCERFCKECRNEVHLHYPAGKGFFCNLVWGIDYLVGNILSNLIGFLESIAKPEYMPSHYIQKYNGPYSPAWYKNKYDWTIY